MKQHQSTVKYGMSGRLSINDAQLSRALCTCPITVRCSRFLNRSKCYVRRHLAVLASHRNAVVERYHCIVITDFQRTKLYLQFSQFQPEVKMFLKFRKFQPRYSYKIYSNRTKECIHDKVLLVGLWERQGLGLIWYVSRLWGLICS